MATSDYGSLKALLQRFDEHNFSPREVQRLVESWDILAQLGKGELTRQQIAAALKFLRGSAGACLALPRVDVCPKDEPIRRLFPEGWYSHCLQNWNLDILHLNTQHSPAKFQNTWFLESYGSWLEAKVERIRNEDMEVFIPDPDDWLLPGSKGKNRDETLRLGEEFSKTLPEGWQWEEPSAEALCLTAFVYTYQTGVEPLSGNNYVRCRNRCGDERWLNGGGFRSGVFDLRSCGSVRYSDIGGLRWAVRRGRVRN